MSTISDVLITGIGTNASLSLRARILYYIVFSLMHILFLQFPEVLLLSFSLGSPSVFVNILHEDVD